MSDPTVPAEKVTMIGTGDGGVPLTSGTIGKTPDHLPNLVLNVVSPMMAITVRAINTYLTLLVGVLTAGMTSDLLPYHEFYPLLIFSAKLSVSGAIVGTLKDIVTVFGKLEGKFPLLTGSV